jgi:hypothetical protein
VRSFRFPAVVPYESRERRNMSPSETQQVQEMKQVKTADPFEVIATAQKRLHDLEESDPWLNELLSRYEAQCKATFGAVIPAGSGSSR